MTNIRPVSDLRNYNEVLSEVREGSPVYLTKNGRGKYVIIDIDDESKYRKAMAQQQLMAALEAGRRSAEEEGTVTLDEVIKDYEDKYGHGIDYND